MQATFRVDATAGLGAGHVMRCLALAEELASRGAAIVWQGCVEVPWVKTLIESQDWIIEPVSGDAPSQAHKVNSDLVVIDSYSLDWSYRETLMARGVPVVAIVDDFHQGLGPANLWVNPGVPLSIESPDSRLFLNGPEYLLIRSEIRALRDARVASKALTSSTPKVTVILGGTDSMAIGESLGLAPEVLGGTIQVVAGPGNFPPRGALSWLPAGSGLMTHAALSDLVISPAGVLSWEMLHVGVPMALLLATENQRGNYNWLTSRDNAYPLGTPAQFLARREFRELLDWALARDAPNTHRAGSLVDGQGAARVADEVIALV